MKSGQFSVRFYYGMSLCAFLLFFVCVESCFETTDGLAQFNLKLNRKCHPLSFHLRFSCMPPHSFHMQQHRFTSKWDKSETKSKLNESVLQMEYQFSLLCNVIHIHEYIQLYRKDTRCLCKHRDGDDHFGLSSIFIGDAFMLGAEDLMPFRLNIDILFARRGAQYQRPDLT